MQTLTSPLTTQTAAPQSGWCELYDFYLPSPIATPFGATATLRLCDLPGGITFFTPKIGPEPAGTQGNSQAYTFWPLKRQVITGSAKFSNDKLTIVASNVTGDWAAMLNAVDWEAVAVTVRKISTTLAGTPTADDCAVIFAGSIDSVKVTLEQIQFTVSNDLGAFQLAAPRENMHSNCRFNWADDQCTAIRFLAANYKSKTCDSASTTTSVKSSDLTEDSGSKGASYGADLVDALADGKITASSAVATPASHDIDWPPFGSPYFALHDGFSLAKGQQVSLSGSPPGGLSTGVTYFVEDVQTVLGRVYYALSLHPPPDTKIVYTGSAGSTTLSTIAFPASSVKASYNGASYWAFDTSGSDWGNNTDGYWQIPDAQAGLKNPALTPYIQFDFGSAKQPRLWQVQGAQTTDRESLPRLLQFFSSTNNTDWKFETYFEMPPIIGGLYDVLIPGAANARYWRICIRNRWSATVHAPIFQRVSAYADSRHYWQNGIITFDANTATVPLRGISRAILESYSGELICAPLPVAPAAGDTFVIERGCARTFNACAARQNTENFGGFNTLPYTAIIAQ